MCIDEGSSSDFDATTRGIPRDRRATTHQTSNDKNELSGQEVLIVSPVNRGSESVEQHD